VSWDFDRYLDTPDEDELEERPRRPAPGKVTLTAGLSPPRRSARGTVPSGAAASLSEPVQRKVNPGTNDDPFGWDQWGATSNERVQAAAAHGVSSSASELPYLDRIQRSFGHHEISAIRAHVGGQAADSSAALGAHAYATGRDVAFARDPDLHTAAHEAAHVVQQRGGVQLMGGVGEVGDVYERHADAVADKVVAGESAQSLLDEMAPLRASTLSTGLVQRAAKDDSLSQFLEQLTADLVVQSPRPLRLDAGKPGVIHLVPTSAVPLPASAARVPLYCKLLDATGRSVAEGSGEWHPAFVAGSTLTLTVPGSGADVFELHVNAGRAGARVLTRPLEIERQASEREKAGVEREAIKTKLLGLEDAYHLYRDVIGLKGQLPLAAPELRPEFDSFADDRGRELAILVKRHGFSSILEFQRFIAKFERAFEREAVDISKEVLQKYRARLSAEAARYRDPAQVAALHSRLGGFRGKHEEFEKHAKASNAYLENHERAGVPGQAHLQPDMGPAEAKEGHAQAMEARASAQAELGNLSAEFPIFEEHGLPVDRRIDKPKLARAGAMRLGALLQSHIERRFLDVAEAQVQIAADPRLVYRMDKLMPQFYARQGIAPGSIYDLIVADKRRDDEIAKVAADVALALIAIAIVVATGGAGAPAAVAVAGSALGAGIGIYGAVDAYKEHEKQAGLAGVGFAEEPATAWLVLSIVAAGFDVAAASTAIKALAPAARALHAGGGVDTFNQAVLQLEKAGRLEARIARAAEKAAIAEKEASVAFNVLLNEFSKGMGANGGKVFDGKVIAAAKQVIVSKSKHGFYTAQMWIDDLKRVRAMAKMPEMSPEELAEAKRAWGLSVQDINAGRKTARAPKSWDKFHAANDAEFKERLRAFRGNDELGPDYSGSEGRIFAAKGKSVALKRWFSNRLSDMPASLSKLEAVAADVSSNSVLGKHVEVVKIHEKGPDWILRDFDIETVELRSVVDAANVASVRSQVMAELERLERSGGLSPMLADLLKKVRKVPPSANLHWSVAKQRIVVIDMQ
jgi:hypothetical protein